MSYSLNDDPRQIQDPIRRVAKENGAARAEAVDRTTGYPEDMYALLKEPGLFALPSPHEYGGTASMLSDCLAIEELGRVCYYTPRLLLVTPRSCRTSKGTNQIQRNIVATAVLGRPQNDEGATG